MLHSEHTSDVVETLKYVAKNFGPGCGSDLDTNEVDCIYATEELGLLRPVSNNTVLDNIVGSFDLAPPGCFAKKFRCAVDCTFYNTNKNGKLGGEYISICKNPKAQGRYMDN